MSLLLLVFGLLAVAGNFIGGQLAGQHLSKTVRLTVFLFLGALLIVAAFPHHAGLTAIGIFLWALAWGMAPVSTQLWLASATTHAPEASQSLNTAMFQLSITMGSLIGGVAVDHIDLRASMGTSCVLLLLAVGLAALSIRLNDTKRPGVD